MYENIFGTKGFIMKLLVAVVAVSVVFGGCSYLNKATGLKQDNVIEETVEEYIEHNLGIEIDLTPEGQHCEGCQCISPKG